MDKYFETITTILLWLFFTIAGGVLAWWCLTSFSFFIAIFVFMGIASISMVLLSPVIGIGIPLIATALAIIALAIRAITKLWRAA